MSAAADWLTLFDRVYIISLATRADRRREMRATFADAGLDPHVADASFFDAVRPADAGAFPSVGARGCFLSHLGVLDDAIAAGHRRILVLEDDADFTPAFTAPAAAATRDRLSADGWSIAYGGYAAEKLPPLPRADSGLVSMPAAQEISTTHMLAFNGTDAMKEIADYLRAMLGRPSESAEGGPMHVDGAYSWYRRHHPQAVTLLAAPELAVQRASRTDIHALRWYDRLPVLRQLAALARRVLRR